MESEDKKMLFRTPYNQNEIKNYGEMNSGEINVIDGQSMSVRTILERYLKGQPIDSVQRNGYYSGATDFEDIDETQAPDFDLIDAHERLQEIRERAKRKKEEQISRDKNLTEGDNSSGNNQSPKSPLSPTPGE